MRTTRATDEVWICATCGVEHADGDGVCPICADERQWVPAGGQRWTTLRALAAIGHRTRMHELEPGLLALSVEPKVGIGQTAFLAGTEAGCVLWDPPGFVDDAALERIAARAPVLAIAASHPHMFGAQLEWSRRLGAAPVLVCEPDLVWVSRTGAAIETWSGRRELAPGLTLHQFGGHFPGSAVLHVAGGAGGRGALLSSDTIHANPDQATVTFLRSYPNRIPLSPAVVQRIARAAGALGFDRLHDNFGRTIDAGAHAAVQAAADRYVAWARGDFDNLT